MHRALQDAQATAELLLLFLSWLQEQGMSTLEEVARFCEPGARRNYHKISLTETLPTTPGVYVMRDEKGAALYIGKAENLRRRTRDHFLQRQAYYARQALELLDHIDVVETGSEFGALLLEERLIARHRPIYNSHGTRVPSYHYVKLSADEYPRLYATPNLRDDGSYYAGPFRKASLARRFVDCVNGVYPLRTCAHLPAGAAGGAAGSAPGHACPRRGTGACLAPCSRPAQRRVRGAWSAEVRRVLEGHGDELDERLQERQAAMVRALAFEQAARLQKQREALERALRNVRRLRAARRADAVLVYPAKRRRLGGALGRARRPRRRGARGRPRGLRRGGGARASSPSSPRPRRPRPPLPVTRDRRDAARALLGRPAPRGARRARSGRDLVAGRRPPDSAAAALRERVRLCAAPEAAAPAGA